MNLAYLGRMLKTRGRKVWVITYTKEGAMGEQVGIDLFGGTKLLAKRQLWQGELLPPPEKVGLKSGEAVILLVPRSWILIKQLSFPALEPEQLARVVPFQLEEALPGGEVITAWHQVAQQEGTGATAYALAQTTLDPLLELFQKAELNLLGIAPYSWAQAQALDRVANCKDEEVLLLASYGGTVEFLQIAGNLQYSYPGQGEVLSALETFIESQGRPNRLILAGDYDPALVGQLRQANFAPEEAPPLPVALTTVEAFLRDSFPDLSPLSRREARKNRERQLGNYFLVGLATILLLSCFGWLSAYHEDLVTRHNRATVRLTQLEARAEEKLPQNPELTERSDWLSTWAAVTSALPENIWLSELRLEHKGQLGIMGFALAQSDVAILIDKLRAQGLGPVILNYTRKGKIGEREVTEFYLLSGEKAQ